MNKSRNLNPTILRSTHIYTSLWFLLLLIKLKQ